MRTKTLLLAAALAAGFAITGTAQTVYSINAVGYVNKTLPQGFAMIANPLNTTNNTLAALMPNAPDGTIVYKYTGNTFVFSSMDDLGEWSIPDVTLNPGEGCFVFSPAQWTNTFVGEVMQGDLSNSFPQGFAIRGSQVPQDGSATQLGLIPQDGTIVYKFNPDTDAYVFFSADDLGWSGDEPSFAVGEAFWLFSPAAGNWTRSFTINTP